MACLSSCSAARTFLLLLELLLQPLSVVAFDCPQQSTVLGISPRANQPVGSTCGGACGFHGSCAAGLVCKEPVAAPLLQRGGLRTPGVCAKARGSEHAVLNPAINLLNGHLHGHKLFVPVRLYSVKRRQGAAGSALFDLVVAVKMSGCWNDGRHRLGNANCEPLRRSVPHVFDMQVLDSQPHLASTEAETSSHNAWSSRYRLVRAVPTHAPVPSTNAVWI